MQQSLHVTAVLAARSGQVYILAVSSAVNYVMLHFLLASNTWWTLSWEITSPKLQTGRIT